MSAGGGGCRKNRGSRGGRPTSFGSERYKKRNTVERAINRLKGFRAVATRYEKRAHIHLGTVTLAALIIWLRHDPRTIAQRCRRLPASVMAGARPDALASDLDAPRSPSQAQAPQNSASTTRCSWTFQSPLKFSDST